MWFSIAFVAALSLTSARPGGLTLSDVRFTHGILGPERADSAFLPGDSLTVGCTIAGLRADDQGKVRYAIATEVADARGEVELREQSSDLEAVLALGGGRLPASAQVTFGVRQPPGEYTLKVTVTDRAGKQSQSLVRPFQIKPPAFGLVRLTITADPDGRQPAGLLGPGQSLFVNALGVGFARDDTRHQPDLTFELRVLDLNEDGKPTLVRPFTGAVRENIPERATSVPVQFLLLLNRPGRFTAELMVTDKVAHRTATRSLPLTVSAEPTPGGF